MVEKSSTPEKSEISKAQDRLEALRLRAKELRSKTSLNEEEQQEQRLNIQEQIIEEMSLVLMQISQLAQESRGREASVREANLRKAFELAYQIKTKRHKLMDLPTDDPEQQARRGRYFQEEAIRSLGSSLLGATEDQLKELRDDLRYPLPQVEHKRELY